MAGLLRISETDFIGRFTDLNRHRTGLVLKNRPTHECIFLDERDCRVQKAKPHQCAGFPNLWRFPEFEAICQAVPREVTPEEWARRIGWETGGLQAADSVRISPSPVNVPAHPE